MIRQERANKSYSTCLDLGVRCSLEVNCCCHVPIKKENVPPNPQPVILMWFCWKLFCSGIYFNELLIP